MESEAQKEDVATNRVKTAVNGDGSNKENLITHDSELPDRDILAERQTKSGSTTTPISRLVWQDLMGATDAENNDEETSPNERLLWHNDYELDVNNISPLVHRRGKKRARSSSPTSSSPAPRTPAVNVKRLKQALKSPNADPALDLWDRFSVNGPDTQSPLGTTNPALAHLMVSSSPRPTKEGSLSSGEGNLRRALSCGSHWPKRGQAVEAMPKSGPTRGIKETSKLSMVTELLQTVNGEINKTKETEEGYVESESPSSRKQRHSRNPTAPSKPPGITKISQMNLSAKSAVVMSGAEVQDPKASVSDYEDDDFEDGSIWEELDASLLSGQVEAGNPSAAPQNIAPGKSAPLRQQDSPDDDFDDLDDDLFAAADELIAEGESKQSVQSVPERTTRTVHLDGGTEDADDVYGDDFGGDFDFAAAELAATQSVDQSTSSMFPVRTIR